MAPTRTGSSSLHALYEITLAKVSANSLICIARVYIYLFVGQPIGWCISDRETTEVIEIFLQCIRERSPDTKVAVVMTDDGILISTCQILITFFELTDNTGWTAACHVFGDTVRHLLCSWHIHR